MPFLEALATVREKVQNPPSSILSIYLPKGPDDNNTEWIRTYKSDKNTKVLITGDFNTHSPFGKTIVKKQLVTAFLKI